MTTAAPSANAEAVARAIRLFRERTMADESLSWAFAGVDDNGIERHARAFVIAALGGTDLYVERNMHDAHARFRLTDEHFDSALAHLLSSLGDAGIADSLTATLAARLEPLRRQIITS